jgi:hypothetical protein
MKFGRKKDNQTRREPQASRGPTTKRSSQTFKQGDPHRQDLPTIQRQAWNQPQPDPGLPGTCGYFNGIKDGDHPSRFVYVRPDGRPDDGRKTRPGKGPLLPSQRTVKRGLFR